MDVNEYERLSNITLRHKLKSGNNSFIASFTKSLILSNLTRESWSGDHRYPCISKSSPCLKVWKDLVESLIMIR